MKSVQKGVIFDFFIWTLLVFLAFYFCVRIACAIEGLAGMVADN